MIALPPLEAGAVQLTVACPFPATAVTPVGAPAGAEGTTGLDTVEAGPVPTAFVAATVNEYVVPLVSPVIVAFATPPATPIVCPPGVTVTV